MNEPLLEEEVNLSYNETFTFSAYDIHALFKVSKIALSIVLPEGENARMKYKMLRKIEIRCLIEIEWNLQSYLMVL